MAGTLYIVATPIGNLDDMTPRAAAAFGAADFVAAEDTRVTMRLLNHLGLKKPMVSYHEHALNRGEGILRRIEAGGDLRPLFRRRDALHLGPGGGHRPGRFGPGDHRHPGAGGFGLRHRPGGFGPGHHPVGF